MRTNIELGTLDAIKTAARKYSLQVNLIWEQRRYEVARDIFVRGIDEQGRASMLPKQAVELADDLIKELTKDRQ